MHSSNGHAAAAALPERIFLAGHAARRFKDVAAGRDALRHVGVRAVASYSVKTNPRAEMLALALEHNFLAEVISPEELDWALMCGFAPEQIIYNGPNALRQAPPGGAVAVAFAGSVEAFRRYCTAGCARMAGLRLRPDAIVSRFGIPPADTAMLLDALLDLPRGAGVAVSFHVRRGDYAGRSWREIVREMIRRAVEIERLANRPVSIFDIGGSWQPAELDTALTTDFPWLLDELEAHLPGVETALFEPGQSIATPVEALIVHVIEIRRRASGTEIVVDASCADLPHVHEYRHPMFIKRDAGWEPLGSSGNGRIVGRVCLEYDIFAEALALPADIAEGDTLMIADCGSYDHSMAFTFARGGAHPPQQLL